VTSNAPRPELLDTTAGAASSVALTRTARGWAVLSPAGREDAADLMEGLSLADLVAEELGALVEPDRTARRSARGLAAAAEDAADPVDARIAALERTVAQLEHALAARVSTERAIGVLAERHRISARAAFESLRGDARSQGRPVADLAREVLEGLGSETPAAAPADAPPSDDDARNRLVAPAATPPPRVPAVRRSVGAADGRS
jgi:hypothetical protein